MHEQTVVGDPAQDFWLRWRRGERPAVGAFLEALGGLSAPQVAAVVQVDQRERWALGERVPAADYFRDFPTLKDDPQRAVELIYGEFLLREELGEAPDLQEYQRAYPDHAGRLAIQVELHRALEGSTGEGSAGDTRQGAAPHPDPDDGPRPDPKATPPQPEGYEILEELGRGGMGVVYKARDTRLGRFVALKFLDPWTARDPRPLVRFRREARAASALNHPAICTLHGLGEDRGRPFLVLEWIEGQTLRALAGPHPDLDRLPPLARQVAEALRAAHAAGIVHRDIKPENLMVRPDGLVKVLDFGLARLLPAPAGSGAAPGEAVTDAGTLLGTAHYMSPEQARGEPVDGATDIFALGIVLYELATGRHPFRTATSIGTLNAIENHPPVPPARLNPEIPAALEALILQMLEKDPLLRPTAAAVEEVLEALADRGACPRAAGAAPIDRPRTVGRDQERAALWAGFESAAAGRGRMLCVTGEPGIGKTTLVEGFLAELAATGRDFVIARGRCSERLAGAEAYLPVLEALDSLVRGAAGAAAARAMRVLAPTWYAQVAPPAAGDPAGDPAAQPRAASQERMKRELLAFVEELARARPLVLFLDDVHWADVSTVDLLAYLGARCAGVRSLLLLTYRPTELLLGPHPFVPAQLELQRHGVCREVPLGLLSRPEVESYLALGFPGHRFPPEFAALIHAQTEGNPLFLVDLLRHLRDRGVIAQGPGGWALREAVTDLRGELPESVRSMIRKKLDQLAEEDRRLLSAAGVQGVEFDSAVVARVLGRDAAEVEERLEVLDRVHGLVRLRREHELPDGTLVLRYQFVHVLYQNALYAALQPTRRAAWSGAVAQELLDSYGGQSGAIAGELALLFEAARDWARAADHFSLAAENAAHVYANREAVALARRGLTSLARLPETPRRVQQELRLQMALILPLQTSQGYASAEVGQACHRARILCDRVGECVDRYHVMWRLALFSMIRDEQDTARSLAEQCLRLAQGAGDPGLFLEAHLLIGVPLSYQTEFALALDHLEKVEALYDPRRDAAHVVLYSNHPVVIARCSEAWVLWALGYADRSLDRIRQALALAEETSHPMTLSNAHFFAAHLHRLRGEVPQTLRHCRALLAVASEQGIPLYEAGGQIWHGWGLAQQGRGEEGLEEIRRGIAAFRATGTRVQWPQIVAIHAEVLVGQGRVAEGLAALSEALAAIQGGSERLDEAELHRLRGEFLLRQDAGPPAWPQAEACFRQALAVARRQGAKTLELRAAVSLARLLGARGQTEEARPLLAEVYGWFTEGRDTPDLKAARAVLEMLP